MLVPRSSKISLGGRRPPRLRSAPSRRCALLSCLSSPSLFLLPFSVFWGLAPPRFQIWCCLSRNSVEAWRRSGCEVPSVRCGRGSLDLASDLDSGSRSVSFLCFLYLPFSAWVRRLAWLKALLGFSRRWRCGVSLLVLVHYGFSVTVRVRGGESSALGSSFGGGTFRARLFQGHGLGLPPVHFNLRWCLLVLFS
ncbi:hypothetical protein F2Q68_00026877 [Brassica cretica]|uniref:Transmembrane protein n=1 Tax=Brassica cretica TaxID=69181 RepID=A0A8S9IJ16_BRACR|nr:hypothetical protein F2Q68_00026877 [Brassica cretica]